MTHFIDASLDQSKNFISAHGYVIFLYNLSREQVTTPRSASPQAEAISTTPHNT
jgi:hypothetical protein